MILKINRGSFSFNPSEIILTGIVLLATAFAAHAQTPEKTSEQSDTSKVAATPTPTPLATPTIKPTPSATPTPTPASIPTPIINNSTTKTNSPNLNPREPDPVVVTTAPTPTPILAAKLAPTAVQLLQDRLAHARALAILGNYQAAATELAAVRAQTTDSAIRDVASIMLLGVQIKTGAYGSASAMLQESFNARAQNSQNRNLYFSLTGQMLHSVRLRLDRYREFGVMTTDSSAPNELRADLDGMRILLEQIVEQAQQINDQEGRSLDASALIEDAASLRMSLARNVGDRNEWQREVAEARVQLATPGAKKKNQLLASIRNNAPAVSASKSVASSAATSATFQPMNGKSGSASPNNNPVQNTGNSTGVNTNNAGVSAKNDSTGKDVVIKSDDTKVVDNAPVKPVAVGSLIEKATQRIAPNYPSTARNARVAGTVTVYVIVDEKGEVKDVQKATGPDLLRTAAQDAARRWRFQPTYINGQPVRVSGFVTFNFTL